jgi:CheY-like chemotaxis protein/signal transduction histidine kinase
MSLFFTPTSKIQKDRSILKTIDQDLATRSLPGVFSYFLIYLLIDFVMGYPDDTRLLSFGFGLVALFIAIARIYVALGFDSQYARGPGRWRGKFLWLSMLNAVIWSGMLCFVLIRGEFAHVFTLALVYTAALTAGITTVYAQYVRFVHIYLVVVLVPPAIILMYKLNVLDAIMGVGVIAYLAFLYTEGKKYHAGFWERVASQFELEQKIALLNVSRIENAQRADINENVLSTVMEMIKPPMQGVLGMLSMLSDSNMDADQKKALIFAKQSGTSLTILINDIENYTRLRDGQVQLGNKFFDLRKFAEDTLEELGAFSHSLNLDLSFLYNIDVPSRVSLDKNHIGQVIKSMVTFAIAHADKGEVVFKVATEDAEKGSQLRFCAYFDSDTFDIAHVKAIIGNMRIDNKKELTSTLLSLMISTRLVELMGGKLEFHFIRKGVYRVQANVPIEVSSQQIDAFKFDKSLNGKKIVLLDMPERAGKGLAGETASWGMQSSEMSSFDLDKVFAEAADFLLFNIPVIEPVPVTAERIRTILDRLPTTTQLVLYGTVDDAVDFSELFPHVAFLNKPAGRYSLHRALIGESGFDVDEAEEKYRRDKASKRILLADDNLNNRMVTESLLKNMGYQFDVVSTGNEALDMMSHTAYDLLLVSTQIREINAIELTKHIRTTESDQQKIAIVGLTSKVNMDEEISCVTAGMEDCIAMPMTLQVLEAALLKWVVYEK